VLSDPKKKELFDQYGEDGLKDGFGGGGGHGGANPEDIFSQVHTTLRYKPSQPHLVKPSDALLSAPLKANLELNVP
jgi:DnaJ-class molecular chaperone